ncbi:MAG: transcription elongation factor GreB [Rhodospirillales bacterium]|nr:transcription elongation factor GreB [Rhodospirillales bacterium]MDE2198219.1 transcription elongation factor GreB [Rhodospirillales bacterium]MDE2574981.1 transcription elongation factor GreB [Rhodospirillales bacterium]
MNDDEDDAPPPPGGKNYISPAGHARMVAELHALMRVERPKVVEIVSWAAGNGDRSENGDYLYGKKRLREIDRRARFLGKRLDIAEIVEPWAQPDPTRIFFGAAVTYLDANDVTRRVTILGVDEAEISRGEVSLASPIARALLRGRVGDVVRMQTPRGIEEVEILDISYPPAPQATP